METSPLVKSCEVEAMHKELCDRALEHYEEVSSKAKDWLSTIPIALKFYKNFGLQYGNTRQWTIAYVKQYKKREVK